MTDEPDNIIPIKPKRKSKYASRPDLIDYGPANGPGWGGPAKGAGNHGPGPGRPRKNDPVHAQKIADKQAAADEALATLHRMGMDEEAPPGVRVMALNSVLDRIEGKAIQRVAPTPGGETVEELRTIDASTLDHDERATLRAVITRAKGK